MRNAIFHGLFLFPSLPLDRKYKTTHAKQFIKKELDNVSKLV